MLLQKSSVTFFANLSSASERRLIYRARTVEYPEEGGPISKDVDLRKSKDVLPAGVGLDLRFSTKKLEGHSTTVQFSLGAKDLNITCNGSRMTALEEGNVYECILTDEVPLESDSIPRALVHKDARDQIFKEKKDGSVKIIINNEDTSQVWDESTLFRAGFSGSNVSVAKESVVDIASIKVSEQEREAIDKKGDRSDLFVLLRQKIEEASSNTSRFNISRELSFDAARAAADLMKSSSSSPSPKNSLKSKIGSLVDNIKSLSFSKLPNLFKQQYDSLQISIRIDLENTLLIVEEFA